MPSVEQRKRERQWPGAEDVVDARTALASLASPFARSDAMQGTQLLVKSTIVERCVPAKCAERGSLVADQTSHAMWRLDLRKLESVKWMIIEAAQLPCQCCPIKPSRVRQAAIADRCTRISRVRTSKRPNSRTCHTLKVRSSVSSSLALESCSACVCKF